MISFKFFNRLLGNRESKEEENKILPETKNRVPSVERKEGEPIDPLNPKVGIKFPEYESCEDSDVRSEYREYLHTMNRACLIVQNLLRDFSRFQREIVKGDEIIPGYSLWDITKACEEKRSQMTTSEYSGELLKRVEALWGDKSIRPPDFINLDTEN